VCRSCRDWSLLHTRRCNSRELAAPGYPIRPVATGGIRKSPGSYSGGCSFSGGVAALTGGRTGIQALLHCSAHRHSASTDCIRRGNFPPFRGARYAGASRVCHKIVFRPFLSTSRKSVIATLRVRSIAMQPVSPGRRASIHCVYVFRWRIFAAALVHS